MTRPPPGATPTSLHNNSSERQKAARQVLQDVFAQRPFDDELLLTNFGLFARASALAKVLFIEEAYRRIRSVPGDLYVFGVWLGQDLVLLESMRAIFEPYNAARAIVGFDTFSGYPELSDADRPSDVMRPGGYSVAADYAPYLERLLAYHRSENSMGHAMRHLLVQGDVTDTLPRHLAQHPESLVALAYFDMALHEPTAAALAALSDRLLPGSVLVMDQLNDPRYPGETRALREWLNGRRYEIERSQILPDRSFVVLR